MLVAALTQAAFLFLEYSEIEKPPTAILMHVLDVFSIGLTKNHEARMKDSPHYRRTIAIVRVIAPVQRTISICLLLIGAFLIGGATLGVALEEYRPEACYPPAEKLLTSPGDTTYYVDPTQGDDGNTGTEAAKPWRSLKAVNRLLLAPGDCVQIRPGKFTETLRPSGQGTAEKPIDIRFAAGEFDFWPDNAMKLKLHISNDNDDPYTPKAIALLADGVRHMRVTGDHSDIYVHGKMIQTMFDHAEDIELSGLAFDYRRPTVSEFTVVEVAADHADVEVCRDSKYVIEDGRLAWLGDGWRSDGGAAQEYDPTDNRLRGLGFGDNPLGGITKVEELGSCKLRLFFESNPGLVKGHVLQFREVFRDCSGGLVNRCKNITWRDCAYHFMHGLGIVSQFSENLTFDHVVFAPRAGSGRIHAGWADLLHFSGCRGAIQVLDCQMSGTQDDPINVHGTHLRVVGRPEANKILVRFMHPQTYGIEAFTAGDEIEFVSHTTLRAYAANVVKQVEPRNDKDIILTLENDAPANIAPNDVIENVTWTPEVVVRGCTVSVDSCRGFLLATRRPIVIENNTFTKTSMSAILIADDANFWFESGPVRDVAIHNNRFIKCAEPVIRIAPENLTARPNEPVHENIKIIGNDFDLLGGSAIAAKSVKGLTITDNRFSTKTLPVQTEVCTEVLIEKNSLGPQE